MPKTKVVLDTNVLISGILFGGNPRQILELVIQGKIDAYISPAILTEFREVLIRPKFGLSQEKCFSIAKEIEDIFCIVFPHITVDLIKDDPDDNIILECALAADVQFIVTGDSHLLSLRLFEKIKIISPAMFVDKFSNS
ncbi:MAG: putative toxin-antitoxin system toxin component, PIN family [Deltaproteobacteria bacterium]|nr:putative toxin-antitoxin system toxin component, PIN family [Deltaproteobacteria bacterium]